MAIKSATYSVKQKVNDWLVKPTHIAPLATLRIAFGVMMLISTVRFVMRGWVSAFYIKPQFHFTFYGFGWVKPMGETGTYALFAVMALAAICIAIGLFYRIAAVLFFLTFTYVELLDKTTYLNHYYLVSIIAFLLILVPAGSYFSVDAWRNSGGPFCFPCGVRLCRVGTRPFLFLSRRGDASCLRHRGSRCAAERGRRRGVLDR